MYCCVCTFATLLEGLDSMHIDLLVSLLAHGGLDSVV